MNQKEKNALLDALYIPKYDLATCIRKVRIIYKEIKKNLQETWNKNTIVSYNQQFNKSNATSYCYFYQKRSSKNFMEQRDVAVRFFTMASTG